MTEQRVVDVEFYVPVKDGEAFIGECLRSILSQTYKPRRVVVYYNVHSRDRTRAIVESYPVEIRDVTVPLSDARNLALNELQTEWIGCCDADVILKPDWLERLYAHTDESWVMIGGNTEERILGLGDEFRALISPHNWGKFDVVNPYMLVPDMLLNRDRILKIGGYQTGWTNYEDSHLTRRLKHLGERIYYAADACATHWRSDDLCSILDLRWRYSCQRQVELMASEDGLIQKIHNNIAMATLAYGQVCKTENPVLMALALFLPIHHAVQDLKAATCQMERGYESGAKIGFWKNIVRQGDARWHSAVAELPALWSRRYAEAFCKLYNGFIKYAYLGLHPWHKRVFPELRTVVLDAHVAGLMNRYALSQTKWEEMARSTMEWCRRLCPKVRHWTTIDIENLPAVHARIPEYGILTHRQKVYPTGFALPTCRDMTEWLAQQNKDIVWTETFQATSIIAFGPRHSLSQAPGYKSIFQEVHA